MNWADAHRQSELLASAAELARRTGRLSDALSLYAQSAQAGSDAYRALAKDKPRTRGITAVSAVSLWYKAQNYEIAEALAYSFLASNDLPPFAIAELRTLVQALWTQAARKEAGVDFLHGQVNVSVKGGEVVTGGAPLDLVIEKVQTIQSIFFRTVEQAQALPIRKRGLPQRHVQEACRPWLFQAPPGSYQFTVVIQKAAQVDLFRSEVEPDQLALRFLEIVRAATSGDDESLDRLVPEVTYQAAFLKLARNLAPTGGAFSEIQISTPESSPVGINSGTREIIGESLKRRRPPSPGTEDLQELSVGGILRAVDLDKDRLNISLDGNVTHVFGLEDTHDDVIGPMMNKRVLVTAVRSNGRLQFRDIQLDG